MGEQLFGEQFMIENSNENSQNEMLKTIRFPQNLAYLTDRLPKPNYMSSPRINHQNHSTLIRGPERLMKSIEHTTELLEK